jgi:dCTP deaminase
MERATVVIEPFVRANLATSSYDVTLGPYYYRETCPESGVLGIYNPYSEEMVKKVWGEPHHAELAGDWTKRTGVPLENISADDFIIWLAPGETCLCHTQEFIGGRETVTTMMKARSSMGRNFIEVCKCAGWGDVGYINRWTMEITNNSQHYAIPLVVGRRIAQIVFFECEGIESQSYESSGKYQSSASLEELKKQWNPTAMLPKMYRDREVRAAASSSCHPAPAAAAAAVAGTKPNNNGTGARKSKR